MANASTQVRKISAPTLVGIRAPEPDKPELVVSYRGRVIVVPLTQNHIDLLALQAVQISTGWPKVTPE